MGAATMTLHRPTACHNDEIVGASEIAARLGATPGAVSNWLRRNVGFPPPFARLNMGALWWWSEVAAWHAAYRPRRGGSGNRR